MAGSAGICRRISRKIESPPTPESKTPMGRGGRGGMPVENKRCTRRAPLRHPFGHPFGCTWGVDLGCAPGVCTRGGARRAQQEGPYHADPVRSQSAHSEVGVVAALAVADDGSPEFLDPFAVAFLDPQVDAHGVTGPKLGDLGVDGGFDRLALLAHQNHLAWFFRTTAAPDAWAAQQESTTSGWEASRGGRGRCWPVVVHAGLAHARSRDSSVALRLRLVLARNDIVGRAHGHPSPASPVIPRAERSVARGIAGSFATELPTRQ